MMSHHHYQRLQQDLADPARSHRQGIRRRQTAPADVRAPYHDLCHDLPFAAVERTGNDSTGTRLSTMPGLACLLAFPFLCDETTRLDSLDSR